MKRRTFMLGSAAAAGVLAAPAYLRAQDRNVLKVVPHANLTNLDPMTSTAYITRHHGLMVYDMLYGMDADYVAQPQMLESGGSDDGGRTWRFKLRPGLMFHDGEPVRARDCVASIRRWAQIDNVGLSIAAITDEMVADDDSRFTIRLSQPFPLLPDAFAKLSPPILAIMPERLALTPATTQITDVVGSGPFRFNAGEMVPGALAVYERFDGYVPRDGTPSLISGPKVVHFDRVEWHRLADPATIANAVISGEMDWWEYIHFDFLPMLRASPDIEVGSAGPGFHQLLVMNCLNAPTDNAAFRRVLLSAIHQPDYMMATAGMDPSLWQDGMGFFSVGSTMETSAGLEGLDKSADREHLKRMLAESGYAGEPVVLLSPTGVANIGLLGDVANQMMTDIGINVDYQQMDWGAYVTRYTSQAPLAEGGFNLYSTIIDGFELQTPLVNRFLRGTGRRSTAGWLDDPELEALRDRWMLTEGVESQREIAALMQKRAVEQVPFLPLGRRHQLTAYRTDIVDRLEGVTMFWNVRREA